MSCVEDFPMPLPVVERPGAAAGSSSAARRWGWEGLLSACALLAAVACFAALAWPFFAGRVYVADDLGEFHLPVRDFYARQLVRGEPFDWMPNLFGGFYIAAEGQLGAYHPWHRVLYRFLPLEIAFDVELLASYPLLFAGAYVLFRRLVGRRDAALVGALVFTFGPFSLLHFVHPNAIAIVTHLPWLLVAIDVALSTTSRSRRAAANLAVGLLTASQLLLGYPQYVWFSLLAEAAFVGWRVAAGAASWRHVAAVAAFVALGFAAGAVQWMPTLHLLGESTRQTYDAAFSETGSLHPLNLVQLLAPYLFRTRVVGQNTHELGMYIGAVPLVLWVWLLANRRRWGQFQPLVWAFVVFGSLAIVLAFGEFGGLYKLQSLVPLVNRFRFPCRAIVLVQLAAAGGAAVAAAILFGQEPNTDRRASRRALRAVFLASVLLAVVGPLAWPDFVARPLLVWTGPVVIGAAVVLVILAERGFRGAAMGLVVLTAFDLTAYGLSYSVYGRTARLDEFAAGVKLPPDGAGARVAAPDTPSGPRVGNRMLLAGLSRVDGYAGLEPERKLDDRTARAWQLAGAAWALVPQEDGGTSRRHWVRVANSAARARLVGSSGSARIVADTPGRITIEVDAPGDDLLAATESFDSGWRAWIDGTPQPVVRVEGDFLGCRLPRGNHRVEFEFRPRAGQLGMIISACGLGLMMIAAGHGVLRSTFSREPRRQRTSLCESKPCCDKP